MVYFFHFHSIITILNFIFVYSYDDTDVIFMKKKNSENLEIPIEFTAFGETFHLKLRRNDRLLAPYFQVWRHDDSTGVKEVPELSKPRNCQYLHQDEYSTAAVSFHEDGVHGIILLDNVTIEIAPLEETEENYLNVKERDGKIPHFVKRSFVSPSNYFLAKRSHLELPYESIPIARRGSASSELTIELAVFFDEPGYRLFSPFFNNNERRMRDMLLAYINAVQALYYHPSLGSRITIALVRLDLMKKQPKTLPHYNGQREKLLDSFCNYTIANNPDDDEHPNHWDIGLYVSGLDFYAIENGRKNGVTMGLATVSGVCLHQYSCVIAELGVTNHLGKPYPSAGFTSVYIAAHEIGHNLGMHHDSTGNSCPREGYIMSPSRGTNGETIWSSCSRQVALGLPVTKPCLLDRTTIRTDKFLDHTRYYTLPGREWTAKKQCELLLRDRDASVVTLQDACQSLQCSSPHRSGYYYSGPALDGTVCADGKECRGGQCLPALHFPVTKPSAMKPKPDGNNWGKWKEESCASGCIKKSQGAKSKSRVCNNVFPSNQFNEGCQGSSYDVTLCEDSKICKKRITAEEFATLKCKIFSNHLSQLDGVASGLQAPHESDRPWMGCAIFCKRKDIASYYTPRIELNDIGLDPYFPDGTWCHSENDMNYFCLKHHCLPENFRFGKNSLIGENFDLGLQNAKPDGNEITDDMRKYLSLGIDGNPLSKNLPTDIFHVPEEYQWEDNDYLEVPGLWKKLLCNDC